MELEACPTQTYKTTIVTSIRVSLDTCQLASSGFRMNSSL